MSFGLIGTILILKGVNHLRIYAKSFTRYSASILGWMPFLCWFTMSQTNTTFILPKTYFVLPFLVLHIYYYNELLIKKSNE